MKNLLTVLALCTVMVSDVHSTPLVGEPVEYEYRKVQYSEAIGGGLYRINFTVPVDVFDLSRSYIRVALDEHYWSLPSRPYTQMNVHGDSLYIFDHYNRKTKWKCRSSWLGDIEQARIGMDVIDVSSNNHPKVFHNFPDAASCIAIANQPFIITVIQTQETQ